MPYRTIAQVSLNRLSSLPFIWIKPTLSSLTQRLFDAADATARQHGWHVNSIHHGFGRRYRDRRFDILAGREEPRSRDLKPEPSPTPPRWQP
jgi:hypothetical protein